MAGTLYLESIPCLLMMTVAMRGGHSLKPTIGSKPMEKFTKQQIATRAKTLKWAIFNRRCWRGVEGGWQYELTRKLVVEKRVRRYRRIVPSIYVALRPE